MAPDNKLGLTNSADFAREEERISKKKALLLFDKRILGTLEAGKFSALKAIHKYLFDEIYDFAGEVRTVNLAKGNFRFAPLMYLEAALDNIDKVAELKKSYKQASILTGQYFYLPIQTGTDWQITYFANGVESTLTSSQFEDFISG